MRRVVVAGFVVLLLMLGLASPARAGGSTWEFDGDPYAPGDTVFGWAQVAWSHNDQLGSPANGPYQAYLRRLTDDEIDYSYGLIPDDAVWVAEIVTSDDPYESGGVKWGPHSATLEFVLPDVAPGEYEILHCNDPCTTTLGDITWGAFTVVAGAAPSPVPSTVPSSTTSAAPVTAAPATTEAPPSAATAESLVAVGVTAGPAAQAAPAPDPRSTSNRAWVGAAVAAGLLGVGLAAFYVRRRQSS
ncbi:MAG: hypothetical protein ACR2QE_04720 [Acidimicrobiales bacterium]